MFLVQGKTMQSFCYALHRTDCKIVENHYAALAFQMRPSAVFLLRLSSQLISVCD